MEWTNDQIEVYAAAFCEGDAVWGGRWRETGPLVEVIDFLGSGGATRRVTTLENYELRGGEKIVWLGESDEFRTFGKVYSTHRNIYDSIVYKNDEGAYINEHNVYWGIIPRYEQVKPPFELSDKSILATLEKKARILEMVAEEYDISGILKDIIEKSAKREDFDKLAEVLELLIFLREDAKQ